MNYLSFISASKLITFKKNAFLLVVAMICFIGVNAQDILTKKTGEDIKAKVLEVTTNEIKYKLFDNLNGPTFVVLKSDLIMLRYENGTKDIYNQTNKVNQSSTLSNINEDEMSEKGKNDAKVSYTGKNSGAGWTSATTLIMAPLSGAVVAFLCSNESPSDENLKPLGTSVYKPKDPDFKCRGINHHGFGGFEKVFTAPFIPNSLFGFVKSDISFHGVERIHEQNIQRKLLNYIVYGKKRP